MTDNVIDFRDLQRTVKDHGDALGMLTAFRHAANSLAVEAVSIAQHIEHDDAAKSVLQDVYFLQLIAEAELRLKRVTTGYERLRAVSIAAAEELTELLGEVEGAWEDLGQSDGTPRKSSKLSALLEVLADDLK